MQEVRLQLWLEGCEENDSHARQIVRTTCIDFQRTLTHFSRLTKQPLENTITFSYLEAMEVPATNLFVSPDRPTDDLLDLEAGLAALPLRSATMLMLRAHGALIRELADYFHLDPSRISQILSEARGRLEILSHAQ